MCANWRLLGKDREDIYLKDRNAFSQVFVSTEWKTYCNIRNVINVGHVLCVLCKAVLFQLGLEHWVYSMVAKSFWIDQIKVLNFSLLVIIAKYGVPIRQWAKLYQALLRYLWTKWHCE